MNTPKEFPGQPAMPLAGKFGASSLRPRRSMHALESRIVFDGAAATALADPHPDHAADSAPDAADLAQPAAVAPVQGAERHEVVFIESNVSDYQALLNGINPGAEVHVLDAAGDGLAQIAQILDGRSGIDAIHIISHGSQGSVQLGTLALTAGNLQDHAADLAAIGGALDANADILLYGCDVGAGSNGAALVAALADATKADVAASADGTGAAGKGGNWTLERQTGQIEADNPFSALALSDYDHLLLISNGLKNVTPSTVPGAFITGFTLTKDTASTVIYTDDPLGIYFYNPVTPTETAQFTVSADGINVATFDLTAVVMPYYAAGGGQPMTVSFTGYKSGGGTVTTSGIVGSSGSLATVDFSAFTGITGFTFTVTSIESTGNLTWDSFTINNAAVTPPPTVTDANISISGGTGTGGAYKVGDTVTATWNNTSGGDNNAGITGVTVDFSAFGGGTAVTATNSGGTWTATYTILSGAIDGTNKNVSVTASNGASTTTADSTNAIVDNQAPTVTDPRISISGGSGPGGAFKIGDTVTATWNNTAGGDNNADISGVTVSFGAFGGGTVAASNSGGTWTATYTIVAGAIDATNRNVSVTATDNAGNTRTTADSTNATVDNIAPTVSNPNISISSGSGPGGAFKIGDTVTATWNNTAGGDNNADTIGGVTVDFSQFGGGAAVAASNSGGTWTATYTIVAGAIDGTNRNVSVTVTDNAGNISSTSDTTNATVDNVAPTVSDSNIGISGGSGPGGAFKIGDIVTATWNNTAGGDNNADPVSAVTVDFSAFGGGTAVAASNSGGTWTATYVITAGAIDGTNKNVIVAATDNVGNTRTTADSTNATVDNIAPTVSNPNISISGGSGPGGAFKIGDTVTATWNNTAGGDNNADTISGVTVDFTAFGGGAAVAASNSGGTWTATYTLVAGAIDGTNKNVSVTATDNAGNTLTTADSTNATVDNIAPTVSDPNISLSGGSGPGGSFKIGDTVTATWNNTAGGENNADTISAVTVDFSAFGGGAAVAASNSGGTWTATYTIVAGAIDATNLNVSVTATDNAGNTRTTADSANATVDNIAPPAPAITAVTADSGTAGDRITNDNTLILSGTAAANSTVTVSRAGVGVLGTTTADGTGNWSYNYTATTLADGTYTFTATATDPIGNASGASANFIVTVDTTAAAPTGLDLDVTSDSGASNTDNITNGIAYTIINGGGAEAGATVTLYDTNGITVLGTTTADGAGNWSITSSALSVGSHTLTAKQTDIAGNTSVASTGLAITVDASAPGAPVVTAISTDSGSSGSDQITSDTTLFVSGTAEANATVTVYRGGMVIGTAAADGVGNWNFDYTGVTLADGTYNFTATATDAAGNVSAASSGIGVTIDTTVAAPAFLDLAAASDSGSSSTDNITSDTTPTISGTAEAGAAVTLYDTDGTTVLGTTTANGTGNWSITSSALGEGSHTLTARQTDAAGNSSAASAGLSITVDTSAPSAPGVPNLDAASDSGSSNTDNLTNDTTPTINGSAEAGASVTLYDTDGTTVLGTATADGAGNWSITSSALSAGSHTLTARQTDTAGNASAASAGLTIAIDASAAAPTGLDLIAASDSGSSSTDNITSDTTPTINGGGAEAGAAVTLYDTDGITVLGTTTADGAGNWSITSSALTAGSHTLTARQTDVAGNTSAASAGLTVNIDASAAAPTGLDLIAASDSGASNTDNITNDTTPTINGSAEAGATVTLYDTDGITVLGTTTADGSGNWSITSSALGEGGHTLTARQTDVAGNASAASAGLPITIDTTAPSGGGSGSITGMTSDSGTPGDRITSDTTPTLSGIATAGSTLAILRNGVQVGTATADGAGNWSYTSGALADGSYVFTVSETDLAGNAGGPSADFTVAVDTSAAAPAAPDLAAASDSGSSSTDNITSDATPTITGTAEAGAAVTLYDTDGITVLGTTTADGSGNWSITSSALGTGSHTLTARQTDVAGNASVASAGLTITVDTSAAAPAGLDLAAASDSGSSSTDDLTNDTTPTITGGGAEAGATVTLYDTDGITVLGTTTADGAGNWSITSSALGTGSHTLTARQTDVAGNTSPVSTGLTVTIDASATAPTGLDLATASDSGASSTDDITSDTTPTVNGGGAEAGATVTLYDTDGITVLGTTTADGLGNWSITSSALGAGSHMLTARQTDIAGNTSAASSGLTVTIDTSAAAPTGLDLLAGSDSGSSSTDDITNDTTPTISGTAEAGATVTLYDTDGTTVLGTTTADGAGNWSITSTALGAGSHTLTARQTDVAGNTSAASVGLPVTIDASAAAPTGLDLSAASDRGSSNTDDITSDTTPTISGSAEAGATVTLYDTDGTTVLGTTTADGAGNWSITSSALGAGSHTLTARQTDVAGNTSAASGGLPVNIDASAAAPTGLDLSAGSDSGSSSTDNITSDTTPTINGGGAEAGATVTLYDTDGITVLGTTTADGVGNWSVTSSALSAGSHTLTARQTDVAGNTSAASAGLTVKIDASAAAPTGLDLLAGSDSGSSNTDNITSDTTPTINGGGAEAGATVTLYDTDGITVLGTTTADGSGNWSITSSALGEGSHILTARQTDIAGNVSGASTGLTVNVDQTAPATTFSGLSLSADTGTPGDFRTTTATQTITATLSAGLGAGDTVWGSLDNGATWTNLTAQVSGTTLTWTGVTLTGSNTLKLRVTDSAGNDGAATSQAYVRELIPPPLLPVPGPSRPPVVPPAVTLPPPAILPVTQALQDLPSSARAPAILIEALPIPSSGPGVNHDLGQFAIEAGRDFMFVIPKDAFVAGMAEAQLTYQASLADGGPLPSWLRFDAKTGTFSGVAPQKEKGTLHIRVMARDNQGREAATTFTIKSGVAVRENTEPPQAPRASGPLSGKELLSVLGIPGLRPGLEQVFQPGQQAAAPDVDGRESASAAAPGEGYALELSAQLQGEARRFGQAREATLRHLAALEQAA